MTSLLMFKDVVSLPTSVRCFSHYSGVTPRLASQLSNSQDYHTRIMKYKETKSRLAGPYLFESRTYNDLAMNIPENNSYTLFIK